MSALRLCAPGLAFGSLVLAVFVGVPPCAGETDLDLDLALRNAVLASDAGLVDELLEQGAPPEAGLGAAARSGNVALMNVLVAAGADLDGIRASEALIISYMADELETATLLESLGVGLENRDEAGRTALVWAAGRKRLGPLVSAALRRGADVDAASRTGETALMSAARHGRLGAARILLGAGADLELRDRDGWTALMFAVRSSRPKVVTTLLRAGADPNVESDLGWTPLMLAARDGDGRSVNRLLRRGADASYRTWAQPQPLVHAILGGTRSVVRRLLAAGAKPGTTTRGTPLWWAMNLGDRRVVRIMTAGAGVPE